MIWTNPKLSDTEQHSSSEPTVKVYFDLRLPIIPFGMPILVLHRSGGVRQATATVVFNGDNSMFLSVSHTFAEVGSKSREHSVGDLNSFDLGIGTGSDGETDDKDKDADENLMESASDASASSLEDTLNTQLRSST
jgi:hypothetical protein